MNRQLVFETAYKRIRSQGGLSWNGNTEACYYRYLSRACAIGACVPDEAYDRKAEGCAIAFVPVGSAHPLVEMLDKSPILLGWREDKDFLNDLQKTHDNSGDEKVLEDLETFAKRYDLTVPG